MIRFYPAVMRSLFLLALLSSGSVAFVSAQDTVVTFYTHGSMLTTGLPGSNHGIFAGCLFDGTRRLACLLDGHFLKNNRFVVFHLPSGLHTFSASYGKHPAKNSQTTIQLEAGKSLFVRAQSESRGIGILEIEFNKGRLDQVSCEVAQEETRGAKAIDTKHVAPDAVLNLDATQSIPACP